MDEKLVFSKKFEVKEDLPVVSATPVNTLVEDEDEEEEN